MKTAALKHYWQMVACTARHWVSNQASMVGASLAFYCAFSLAPLLVIISFLLSIALGETMANGYLTSQLNSLFGPATAKVLMSAMTASQQHGSHLAAAISVGSLLVGATSIFTVIEGVLDRIWGAHVNTRSGFIGWIKTRVLSLGMVLALGFLLLVSLSLSTMTSALQKMLVARFAWLAVFATLIDLVVSIGLTGGLFLLMFKYLPSRHLAWRPVIGGALCTAILFQIGKWAIGLYLARSTQASAFGAAASFAALLLWLYYSAQIFLFGAEFTACAAGLRDEEDGGSQAAVTSPQPESRQ
jgi:membrane protein